MKITFLGANHEVTGSCTLIEAAGQRFLIDCGMEQGKDVYENQPIPVAPGEIDWVLATHAHIDHTGMLPLLVRNGFRGKIYATNPTVELCGIMLRDSAHIQEFEAEWKNRKGQRSGAEPVEPMYTVQDAEAAMKLFVGKAYEQRFQLAPGIEARFVDVGHLLGSASIELWITEGETTTKLVFSGDIGNLDQPIIKDPAYIKEADYAFMESTYGDRSHGPKPDYVSELTKILQRAFARGGGVVHQFSGLKTCSFRQAEPVTDGSYCHQCFHVVLILNPYLIGRIFVGAEGRAHFADILVTISDISEVKK